MTVKRSRDDREVEVLAMTNCLMLLPSVGKSTGSGPGSDRVFACKTCNRKFPTFQALGGHRASHKKLKLMASDLSHPDPAKPKTHECSVCGLEFPLGQALGGHMRRHRERQGAGSDSDKSTETETEAAPVLEKSSRDRVVFLVDLNLTPYENDLKFA